MPGFTEMVKESWDQPVGPCDAILRIHIKLQRTATTIKRWKKRFVGNLNVQVAVIQVTLFILKMVQEFRMLTLEEFAFRKSLKVKLLGLAASYYY